MKKNTLPKGILQRGWHTVLGPGYDPIIDPVEGIGILTEYAFPYVGDDPEFRGEALLFRGFKIVGARAQLVTTYHENAQSLSGGRLYQLEAASYPEVKDPRVWYDIFHELLQGVFPLEPELEGYWNQFFEKKPPLGTPYELESDRLYTSLCLQRTDVKKRVVVELDWSHILYELEPGEL